MKTKTKKEGRDGGQQQQQQQCQQQQWWGRSQGSIGQCQGQAVPHPILQVTCDAWSLPVPIPISRLSLAYARAVPKQLRRLLECFLLLKAVLAMLLLVYIHLVYTRCAIHKITLNSSCVDGRIFIQNHIQSHFHIRQPVQCLEHVSSSWPREGILRVEIVRSPPDSYSIQVTMME